MNEKAQKKPRMHQWRLLLFGGRKGCYGGLSVKWRSEIRPFKIRKHLKSGILKVRFQMGPFSNGLVFKRLGFNYGYSPNHLKNWTIRNRDDFVQISNGLWQNGCNLSRFQMAGLLDFRSLSKSGLFATQPLFDHSKSRLV